MVPSRVNEQQHVVRAKPPALAELYGIFLKVPIFGAPHRCQRRNACIVLIPQPVIGCGHLLRLRGKDVCVVHNPAAGLDLRLRRGLFDVAVSQRGAHHKHRCDDGDECFLKKLHLKPPISKSLADITVLGGFAALEPLCCAVSPPKRRKNFNHFWGSLAAPKIPLAERLCPARQGRAGRARAAQHLCLEGNPKGISFQTKNKLFILLSQAASASARPLCGQAPPRPRRGGCVRPPVSDEPPQECL